MVRGFLIFFPFPFTLNELSSPRLHFSAKNQKKSRFVMRIEASIRRYIKNVFGVLSLFCVSKVCTRENCLIDFNLKMFEKIEKYNDYFI
jgi:hypothetical protein